MPRIQQQQFAQIPIAETTGGTMQNLFRTMAHRPDIMQSATHLLEAAMRGGTVDPKLKELLALRVSQVNHCFY